MDKSFERILARVEQVRETLDLNKSKFCRGFDMKPQTYNNFLGKQGSKPNIPLILGVSKAYGINPAWLLFGGGHKIGF